MKNLFKSIMMVAVAAISFTSCSNNFTEEIVTGEKIQFNVSAVNEEVTRSAFGVPSDKKYPTLWSGEEGFALNINGYDGKTTKEVEATFSDDKRAVNLSANIEFDTAPETYTLYAIAPATAYVSVQANGWHVTIPASQTTEANSCDPAAQILVGASETKTSASETFDMTFKHAVAYGKMSLINLELNDATISSVAITSTKNIAGRFYINQATREYSDNSGAKTITVNTTSTENIWFALAPVDVSNTELKIVVNTDKGTFTKTVTMPANRKFELGKISTFNVNMNGIELAGPDETATIDFSKAEQRTEFNSSKQVWSNAGITLTNTKDASTSNIGDYTNPARFYKSSKIEVVSAVGNMTKIQFVCNNSEYTTALKSAISGSTASGNTITVVFNEPTTTFTASLTAGQVRMNSLTVTYTPTNDDEPFISIENSSIDVDATATTEEIGVTFKNITEQVTVTSYATWVNATLENNTLKLAIAANTTTAARKANVTISANGVNATITINQKAPTTLETVTIAEFLTKPVNTTAFYQLTGTIINIENTTFGNLTIKDETGEVYVYGLKLSATASNQSFSQIQGLTAGDIVTLIGNRGVYNNNPQVTNAYYVSHKDGEELEVVITPLTIAEFLKQPVSTSALYQLTGTITNIKNTTYGNFDIQDETGTVYVYGLKESATAGNQTFSNLGLKVGDVVTLVGNRAAYNNSPQVGNAYYVSHTSSTTPEPGPGPEPGPDQPTSGYTTTNTSNVTLSTTGGTKAEAAKVKINGYEYSAIKVGTSSVAGAWKVTVPVGTTKLHLHMAGWKGKNVKVSVQGATTDVNEMSLVSDTGINNGSPFTLSTNDSSTFYKVITLSNVTAATTLTFTATSGYRFVVWGVNAEK